MNDVDNQRPIKVATAHGPKICTSVHGEKKEKEKSGAGSRCSASNMLGINSSPFSTKSPLRCCLLPFFSLRAEPCPALASLRQLLGARLPTGVGQKAALLTAGGGGSDTDGEEDD